jgi:hypothetical protein
VDSSYTEVDVQPVLEDGLVRYTKGDGDGRQDDRSGTHCDRMWFSENSIHEFRPEMMTTSEIHMYSTRRLRMSWRCMVSEYELRHELIPERTDRPTMIRSIWHLVRKLWVLLHTVLLMSLKNSLDYINQKVRHPVPFKVGTL